MTINCFIFYDSFIYLFGFFHKQQHQDFVSIIQSMQDDQYCFIDEYGIRKNFINFILFIMIEVFL